MNEETRTKNSIKNSIFSLTGQIICVILNFISRTIFINILSVDYLGISGLFKNVLSVLSLADLGLSTAIIYSMYKPLAEKDEYKIRALMNLYKKTYTVIGMIVGIIGIGLVPFLGIIVKDINITDNIILIYLMFLSNSVISYFFIYKKSIIMADQKNYICAIIRYLFQMIRILLQLSILALTHNYILYLLMELICTFLENLSTSIKADRLYPFLKKKDVVKLDDDVKGEIVKNTKAMLLQKIGLIIVDGTDNILISLFIGVYWVGLYSNYLIIIEAIDTTIYQIFTSITASIGNLNVLEGSERQLKVFNRVYFMAFYIFANASIILMLFLNPFITFWIGENFIMSEVIVLLIVINFYISGMRIVTVIFKEAYGLFWSDRYRSLLEAVVNLVISIVLLKKLGIAGVFLGTTISSLFIGSSIETYIVYKQGLKVAVGNYFKKYVIYTVVTVLTYFITSKVILLIDCSNFFLLILRGILALIVINVVFLLVFCRTDEFKYYISLISGLINKYKNKNIKIVDIDIN